MEVCKNSTTNTKMVEVGNVEPNLGMAFNIDVADVTKYVIVRGLSLTKIICLPKPTYGNGKTWVMQMQGGGTVEHGNFASMIYVDMMSLYWNQYVDIRCQASEKNVARCWQATF